MHKPKTIRKAIELYKEGRNQSQVARELNIPRSTVKDWLRNPGPVVQLVGDNRFKIDLVPGRIQPGLPIAKHYAYVLGIYLGDGHISRLPRTWRLRVFQDSGYPNTIDRQVRSIKELFPANKVTISNWHTENCKSISVYNSELVSLFPQHGVGRKHTRKIKLEGWQENIVKQNTQEFLSGLMDSDGCVFIANQSGKEYVRAQFTNKSEDIKDLFCWVCDLLGISYWRKVGYKNINIQRKKDIENLLSFYPQKS